MNFKNYYFVLLFLTACNFVEKNNTIGEGIKNNKFTQDKSTEILGTWTNGSSENASFDIREDSIYYVDEFTSYKYSLLEDSIKIFYPDWVFTGNILYAKDTLTITSEDGNTKYWRFAY